MILVPRDSDAPIEIKETIANGFFSPLVGEPN